MKNHYSEVNQLSTKQRTKIFRAIQKYIIDEKRKRLNKSKRRIGIENWKFPMLRYATIINFQLKICKKMK